MTKADKERTVEPSFANADVDEVGTRPRTLDEFVGQPQLCENLGVFISAARHRREALDHVLLAGPPGLGKTTLAQIIAYRTESKFERLSGVESNVAEMRRVLSGAANRLENTGRPTLLFIDEIHTIIGAGGASGSMDASNMFKPALARGELQCIGATTLDEYRQYIEKDGALERRFQKVIVEPTSVEETIEILVNIK